MRKYRSIILLSLCLLLPFSSTSAEPWPSAKSTKKTKKIWAIIHIYKKAGEDLKDPIVHEAILDEVNQTFPIKPHIKPNPTDLKDIAKSVNEEVRKKFPVSEAQKKELAGKTPREYYQVKAAYTQKLFKEACETINIANEALGFIYYKGWKTPQQVAELLIKQPDPQIIEAEKISNDGFVFIDGKYIKIPYRVTVNKGWLELNNQKVRQLCLWPIVTESSKKPKMPQEQLKNAKSYKDVPFSAMYRWIRRNIKGEQAQQDAMREFNESLPFVRKVSFPSRGRMNAELKNGKIIKWGLEGVPPIITKEDKLKMMENSRQNLVDRLKKGDLYLFYNKGKKMTYGEDQGVKKLLSVLEVMGSDHPDSEKISQLKSLGIVPEYPKDAGMIFIKNFQPSTQLKERLKKEAATD